MDNEKKFRTHDELKRYVEDFEKKNYVQLFVEQSRTIQGARKKGITRYIKHELKYAEIIYRCIHGPGRHKSKSTGLRKKSSYRQGCPFFIKFKAASDGESLEIADFKNEHNHDISKETSSYLPKFRALDAPTKELTKLMLKLQANKKLVQAELHAITGRNVTMKDLHNLAASNDSKDKLKSALSYLRQKDDCIVEVIKNENKCLQGIFFQDQEMRRVFNCYPQILFVVAIHNLSNHKMPLYILLIEDGNGVSEIVAFYLVTSEDKATLQKLATIFKQHNSSWVNVKSIVTDIDFAERKIFHEEFPNAKLLICLFHLLQIFKREITTEKMGITSQECKMCLKLIQKLAYACNNEDYNEIYQELRKTEVEPVIKYFDKNWHPIKDQWVLSFQQCASVTFSNTTFKRFESINSKITQIVKGYSDLRALFEGLDTLLISLRIQRDSKASKLLLKTAVNMPTTCDAESKYMNYLTPYAYGFVAKKFQIKDKVKVVHVNDEVYTMSSISGRQNYVVTESNCSCPFFITIELPCEHILKVREVKGLDLFCEVLVALRWEKNHYVSNSRLSNNCTSSSSKTTTLTSTVPSTIFSEHEKIRLTASKIQKIASLASETTSQIFEQRMKVLSDLIQMWENNTEVKLLAVNEDFSCEEVNRSQRQVSQATPKHLKNVSKPFSTDSDSESTLSASSESSMHANDSTFYDFEISLSNGEKSKKKIPLEKVKEMIMENKSSLKGVNRENLMCKTSQKATKVNDATKSSITYDEIKADISKIVNAEVEKLQADISKIVNAEVEKPKDSQSVEENSSNSMQVDSAPKVLLKSVRKPNSKYPTYKFISLLSGTQQKRVNGSSEEESVQKRKKADEVPVAITDKLQNNSFEEKHIENSKYPTYKFISLLSGTQQKRVNGSSEEESVQKRKKDDEVPVTVTYKLQNNSLEEKHIENNLTPSIPPSFLHSLNPRPVAGSLTTRKSAPITLFSTGVKHVV